MKVIKFGGKSLANGLGLNSVLEIISSKIEKKEKCIVVVSARGNSTNDLEKLLEKSKKNNSFKAAFELFKSYQITPDKEIDYTEEFSFLEKIFEGVNL